MSDTITLAVGDVVVEQNLYPRLREDNDAIERYRHALDRLPPIVVARGRILVDGYHRWQAHQREALRTIEAIDLGELSDAEILDQAITRNAMHGQQLSLAEKRTLTGKLWTAYADMDGARAERIADVLAVDKRSVQRWTADQRKAEKGEQQARAFDLWLDCLSEREIGERLGMPRTTVQTWLDEKRQALDFVQPPESRQHFDLWQFHRGADTGHFGAMPPQIVENLLWLYTEPWQVVIDPFAGSGTTVDVAKRMGRRIYAMDLHPQTTTLPIHEHDATKPWPVLPEKASLILLDPPYWQQAKGRYSDDSADLGNMDLGGFQSAWIATLANAMDRLAKTGRIAFIVSPTQREDGTVVDHAFDMAFSANVNQGLEIERRIVVPYQTQQATGQQVEWARENRRLLKIYRDLVVLGR